MTTTVTRFQIEARIRQLGAQWMDVTNPTFRARKSALREASLRQAATKCLQYRVVKVVKKIVVTFK